MARDKGTVPYMDFGTVEVNIGDRNDNEPFFKTVSKMKLGMVKNFVFALVHNPLLTLFCTNSVDQLIRCIYLLKDLLFSTCFEELWAFQAKRKPSPVYNCRKSLCRGPRCWKECRDNIFRHW